MFVKVTDNSVVPYSMWDLRNDNPNTSFPSEMSNSSLELWSVYPCVEGYAPPTGECEQLVRSSISKVDGVWTQNFIVERWPLDQAENYVREKRNHLLSETDWMALSDVVMTEQWATYRQQLRDVTSQQSFPYDVVWPTKPE